jgi:AcrR family transcriptional regulator
MAAIRAAVEELVQEVGRERVTIPMIAERAGVNPTSIYRRWEDLPTLINDIATYRLNPARALPDSGDLRQDLTEWAEELVRHYLKPVNAALLRGGVAVAGESESDCLRNRRSELEIILGRGNSLGLSADKVLDHVVAPIIYRVIFLPQSLDSSTAQSLVADLFALLNT